MADDYQNETGTILAGRAARSLSVLPGPRKTQFHRRPLYIVNNVRVRDKDRAANPVYKTVMIVSGVLTLVFAFLAVIMFVNYRSKNFCDKYTPKKKKGKKDKKGKTESSKTKSGTTGTEGGGTASGTKDVSGTSGASGAVSGTGEVSGTGA
ncbi:hypothetical protein Y032_0411g967 [Ancylostoma ceylanicum]|uniref:Uncharacterized protein n=1 Tax=Ancylostoma ceylanicum TaxID=53326 RepID=A0A016X1U2_9BILA|nr:hypothetical protein Y032_0411g967 [Ancylostoma ceylanicum]